MAINGASNTGNGDSGPSWSLLVGDCRDVLRSLPAQSVHTCVTSPPYFGLRDYGTGEWDGGDAGCDHARQSTVSRASSGLGVKDGRGPYGDQFAATQGGTIAYRDVCGRCGARRVDRQIGLEPTPDEFVAALVAVFREVRRVLRDDGTVWLNLGDSYAGSWGNQGRKAERGEQRPINGDMLTPVHDGRYPDAGSNTGKVPPGANYKAKDLLGIPWMVAFALRADGWYLRSDIIWSKPNPMPESVTDRPTKAHEYLFLLSKGPRYFYDADAIREPHQWEHVGATRLGSRSKNGGSVEEPVEGKGNTTGSFRAFGEGGRNKRSVWTIATQPYPGAHFATFPPKLIEPCILAGAPERACGECGAPWERVVERGERAQQHWAPGTQDKAIAAKGRHGATSVIETGEVQTYRTVGFEPSCTCRSIVGNLNRIRADQGVGQTCRERHVQYDEAKNTPAPSVPGVVLDPFAGAGTTGVVALRNNRDFIGIELNAEYAELARPRLERYWVDATRPEEAPQTETLFEV